jgi:hypothetical protein
MKLKINITTLTRDLKKETGRKNILVNIDWNTWKQLEIILMQGIYNDIPASVKGFTINTLTPIYKETRSSKGLH